MRKGQAWPERCTLVSWCCWVKRACAANASWSLRSPATPERVIHHLGSSLTLKHQWENPGPARLRLIMPPLAHATLNWCSDLSQGTLQTAKGKDSAFPAPPPAAAEGRFSSPPSCTALMTLRQIPLGELKKSPGSLIGVSALGLCFTNKLQVNYAYSLLTFLSW